MIILCYRCRVGYLFGQFLENDVVKVECIYEPPQETTDTSFTLPEDPMAVGARSVLWLANLA